jgi:D-alanyl-D-alanine carboxypeptidase (penicillin-binding protein 5/6)
MHPTDVRPARPPARPRTGHRRHRGILILLAGVCGLASAALTYLGLTELTTPSFPPAMSGPGPATPQAGATTAHPTKLAEVSWPADGFSAADIGGVGLVTGPGANRPVPIASVAKVMTAYVILHDHPLADGSGPEITVQPSEAAAYPAQVRAGDSLVPVAAGESLTERQALAALLLPSADNMAWILARWDAGSQAAFVARMNATAQRLGLTGTHYTDPSGLDQSTTSTAADQVRLGAAAMRVPALAAITAMPAAVVPEAGLVRNTNTLLGQDGIAGLKTGSTQAAGGCLLVAAWSQVGGRKTLIVAATFGQPGSAQTILPHALRAGHDLVLALDRALGATAAGGGAGRGGPGQPMPVTGP